MKCPQHGLERFKIKVIKRFNMPPETLQPKSRSRPKPGGLSYVYVGRNVSEREIRKYLIDYFRKRGLRENILTMQFKKV